MISDLPIEGDNGARADKGEDDHASLKTFAYKGKTSVAYSNIGKYDACHVGGARLLNPL